MQTPGQRKAAEADGAAEARALFRQKSSDGIVQEKRFSLGIRIKPNEPGGFGRVMDSIRHEVVERPWYGREVTGNIGTHTGDELQHKADMRSFYGLDQKAEQGGLDIHGNPMDRTPKVEPAKQDTKPPEAGIAPPGA